MLPRAAGVRQAELVMIRDATREDWPAIWAFMGGIVAAGDTYAWDADISEAAARDRWFRWDADPRGHTVVAVADDGTVIGTAETGRNHQGAASHIAGASFMVSPDHPRRGIGRALGEHVLARARADGYRAMQFNAVVETNTAAVALWRSLGFEVLATVPDGFRHPVHGYVGLLIMYRRL
jgi:L-amino acid N-acyltransferase YncA